MIVSPDMVGEDEVLVETHGPTDSWNRTPFTAHWWADNVGPQGNDRGIRSQVFTTDLDVFTARCALGGVTVRRVFAEE